VCIELNPGPQKLDVGKRNQVIRFLKAGGSPADAAKTYGGTKRAINKLKVEETGRVATRPGQGRKRN